MIKSPPQGRIRDVRGEAGHVAPVEARDAVAPENLAGDLHGHRQLAGAGLDGQAERADCELVAAAVHPHHHQVLAEHVEWDYDGLADHGGAAPGDEGAHAGVDVALGQPVAHALVHRDVENPCKHGRSHKIDTQNGAYRLLFAPRTPKSPDTAQLNLHICKFFHKHQTYLKNCILLGSECRDGHLPV